MEGAVDLSGKTALVTNAASGVGLTCAHHLAALGAGVVVCDVDAEAVERAESELEMHGAPVYGLVADVARARDVEALLGETMRVFGRLDIVVVVAPATPPDTVLEIDDQGFNRALVSGVRAPFLVCQRAARLVDATRGGAFVLIDSDPAPFAGDNGATHQMTAAMARELAGAGIRVNAIAAGAGGGGGGRQDGRLSGRRGCGCGHGERHHSELRPARAAAHSLLAPSTRSLHVPGCRRRSSASAASSR
jgi:NAD(P)-dependent dehydrogenase (short-subunit alcohol dehydrogenase family)